MGNGVGVPLRDSVKEEELQKLVVGKGIRSAADKLIFLSLSVPLVQPHRIFSFQKGFHHIVTHKHLFHKCFFIYFFAGYTIRSRKVRRPSGTGGLIAWN